MHFLLSFPVETPQDSSLNSTCVKRKRKIHKTTRTRWTTIKRIRLRPSQKENSTEAPNIGVCLEHSSPGTSQDKKYCDQASQTKRTRKRRCTSQLTSICSSKHIVSKKIKKSSPFRNPTLSPEARTLSPKVRHALFEMKKKKKSPKLVKRKTKKHGALLRMMDEQVLKNLIEVLKEANLLSSFIKLIEELASKRLEPTNMAVLGALERAKLSSLRSSIGMVYDPRWKQFCQVLYRIVKGKGIRFLSGSHHHGHVIQGESK